MKGRQVSEWREVSGVDYSEAISDAVKVLGIAEADMEIEEIETDDGAQLRVRAALGDDEPSDGEAAPAREDAEAAAATAPESEQPAVSDAERAELLASQKEIALDFLVDLLEAFDLEGEIAADVVENVLNIDITGDDLGSLIGRRGSTLAALGEVTKTVVQRRTASRVRLNLDIQGYRIRRRRVLEDYAVQLAGDVRDSGVEKALEPMAASERKIVHDAVSDIDGVRSFSEGSEPRRNVVIGPA